jgi:hypothetical protein
MRNITAQTYDLVKAQQVYAGLRGFLSHADMLLGRLASRHA